MMISTRRRRPARTLLVAPGGNYAPIAAINTTPLIDMMLVILIMLIVSIPLANHKVPLDLPGGPTPPGPPPPTHLLAIDAGGALAWDGQPLAAAARGRWAGFGQTRAAAALAGRRAALTATPPHPVHRRTPAGSARGERFDGVWGATPAAHAARLGFVGNRSFASGLDR